MIQRNTATRSRLVAVWPGMGQVAVTAGYYLMSKLHMHEEEAPPTGDLFDLDHVDIKDGLARAGRPPASHLFVWKDRPRQADLRVLIGEAQPALRNLDYCRRVLDRAQRQGVAQVYTFAALATNMNPGDPARVFGAASDREGLQELRHRGIEVIEEGRITGLNGVFLAAAAERGIRGVCLLGEMPAFATQVPWPKAAHAIADAFARLAQIEIDLRELAEYGHAMETQLTAAIQKVEEALRDRTEGGDTPAPVPDTASGDPAVPEALNDEDQRRVEELFVQASRDRSKAFELKRELDRLGVFKDHEDRFLDIFRRKPA
ncbi:MAG TPA: PAC2 family protein [Planctomycetota bacterium]